MEGGSEYKDIDSDSVPPIHFFGHPNKQVADSRQQNSSFSQLLCEFFLYPKDPFSEITPHTKHILSRWSQVE